MTAPRLTAPEQAAEVTRLRATCVPTPLYDEVDRCTLLRIFPDYERPTTHRVISSWHLCTGVNTVITVPLGAVQ